MQLLAGFIIAVLISVISWRLGSLSRSGVTAAIITGGLIFGLGGIPWAALLLTFFITSSILSRSSRKVKANLSEKFSKGSRRDWGQVVANSGLGTLLVLLSLLFPEGGWPWIAYAGAVAAVNADTWATELGVLSPAPPRLITNGKIVEPGTSGGISLAGTLATVGGAALVGLVGALLSSPVNWTNFLVITITGGLIGSLFDSMLGATIQAIYYCPTCNKETERHPHHICGTETTQKRGWTWLNNDMVNLLASAMGAGIAVLMGQILS